MAASASSVGAKIIESSGKDKDKKQKNERRRMDFTKERSVPERRLDSLAKLLSGYSNCVAVAIINGKLYITANEFHTTSKKNTDNEKLIKIIVNYFKKIANKEKITEEEHVKVFKSTCTKQRFNTTLGKAGILSTMSDEELEKLLDELVDKVTKEQKVLTPDFFKKYGKHSPMASFIYADLSKLYEHFCKLEDSITFDELLPNQIRALKQNPHILKEEELTADQKKNNERVHAELQLLSKVVDMLDKREIEAKEKDERLEIYLGISKLCCLNCRVTLNEANEVLQEKYVLFKTRGKHDLDFDKWLVPNRFSEGYTAKALSENASIADKIGYNSAIGIKALEHEPAQKGSMYGSDSDSESKTQHEREQLDQRCKTLEVGLSFLSWAKEQKSEAEKSVILTKTAIELHKTKAFKLFCQKPITDKPSEADQASQFKKLLTDLKQNKLSESDFLLVLTDPFLVGKNVSDYFKDYKLKRKLKDDKSLTNPTGDQSMDQNKRAKKQ